MTDSGAAFLDTVFALIVVRVRSFGVRTPTSRIAYGCGTGGAVHASTELAAVPMHGVAPRLIGL